VIVTGHTDDIPLSRPTPEFRDNADLAAARAKAAMEHLAHYARANKALTFEMRTGTIADAPYPNDSNRNRRLNRTATVQVMPAHP
jgi:flagellar motor protein MotB